MTGTVNKATLVGYLGKDPEIRSFKNGGRGKLFNRHQRNLERQGTGERKERTEWHRISVLNDGLVIVAEKYLRKGRQDLLRSPARNNPLSI